MPKNVITFHYILKDQSGTIVESTPEGQPVTFLEGSKQILPQLEKKLLFLKPGDQKTIHLTCDQAYGPPENTLINQIPRTKLPSVKILVGDVLEVETELDGIQRVTVKEITPSHVILDGNHPLCGQDLTYEVTLVAIRPATAQEIQSGKVQ